MILTVYDELYFLIAQFDSYNDLSNYMNVPIKHLQCYFAKQKYKQNKKICDKQTNKFVYLRKDYVEY